jgi:hypothetical protein
MARSEAAPALLAHKRARRGSGVPLCECHEQSKVWKSDRRLKAGGSWRCGVTQRQNETTAYASQLARGGQISNAHDHHRGMAELKAKLGDPRPAGMTLSLVNFDSPDTYDGYAYRSGERKPYRLSTNPDDYVWETHAENDARDAARRSAAAA